MDAIDDRIYDAVIIGAGPAGYAAALRIAQLGGKACLIEKNKVGGVCANQGCIPTKTFLSIAHLLFSIQKAAKEGLVLGRAENIVPDYAAIQNQVQTTVHKAVLGIQQLLRVAGVKMIEGYAFPNSAQEVQVFTDGQKSSFLCTLKTKNIILATGSKAKLPPISHPKIITSEEIFTLPSAPKELVIIGGGYIGLEMASIFSGLGSKVTIIEILPGILSGEDPEIAAEMQRLMAKQGITILTDSLVEEFRPEENQIVLNVLHTTTQQQSLLTSDLVLYAVGRIPVFDQELLSKLGIETTASGIVVDDSMRTTLPGIYAVGDVTGKFLLAHVALHQGIIAAESVMGLSSRMDYDNVPRCIYTLPEMAFIGKRGNWEGKFHFAANGRALTENQTEGMVKAYLQEEILVGVSILGPNASELLAFAGSMLGKSYKEVKKMIIAHPTLAEAIWEAVLDTRGEAIHKLPRK